MQPLERGEGGTGDVAAVGVRLTPRPLTRAEAILLHGELKSTANILGYTVNELLHFADVIVAEAKSDASRGDDEGGDFAFAGACISKDLLFGWTDIATLYVLPAFRGRRIGGILYAAAFERAQERKRHIYTLSRSPEIIRVMKRHGMTVTGAVWNAPFAVHWHSNRHMASLYRWREAFRKSAMRKKDGQAFVAGTKRAETGSR